MDRLPVDRTRQQHKQQQQQQQQQLQQQQQQQRARRQPTPVGRRDGKNKMSSSVIEMCIIKKTKRSLNESSETSKIR